MPYPLKKRRPFKGTVGHYNKWEEVDGIKFQSKKEANRYRQLKQLVEYGEISELERQIRFPILINGVKMFTYVADFRYLDKRVGSVVEDVKGVVTDIYLLKKKIVEAVYAIKIMEV